MCNVWHQAANCWIQFSLCTYSRGLAKIIKQKRNPTKTNNAIFFFFFRLTSAFTVLTCASYSMPCDHKYLLVSACVTPSTQKAVDENTVFSKNWICGKNEEHFTCSKSRELSTNGQQRKNQRIDTDETWDFYRIDENLAHFRWNPSVHLRWQYQSDQIFIYCQCLPTNKIKGFFLHQRMYQRPGMSFKIQTKSSKQTRSIALESGGSETKRWKKMLAKWMKSFMKHTCNVAVNR